MLTRTGRASLVVMVCLGAASTAHAASRLVVLPVVVGGGAEPPAPLMTALAAGLRQNPQWAVEEGASLDALSRAQPSGMSEEAVAALTAQVDEAARKRGEGQPAEAVTALDKSRAELLAAGKAGPRGDKADELAFRASAELVAALLAAGEADRARKVADETTLLFPGRKPAAGQPTAEAAALLASPSPGLGIKLTIKTRPDACDVVVGGQSVGASPVEIAVLPGATYHAQARCQAAAAPAGQPAAAALTSFNKRITVGAEETTRQEVLDAEFERAFQADQLRRVRFATSAERRQIEESYARRVAERFDADVVVFASVGELSGADWLNARLYLRSGYLNRQGLVRLEAPRANALGRYLATGKDVPDVLKPEEAGKQLVAEASRAPSPSSTPEPAVEPWYTDVPAWCFVGLGAVTFGLGTWGNQVYKDREDRAYEIRDDYDKQQKLLRDAQNAKFWGSVGTVGGVLMASTGVLLFLIPQYGTSGGELFVLSPTPLAGGAAVQLGGRF